MVKVLWGNPGREKRSVREEAYQLCAGLDATEGNFERGGLQSGRIQAFYETRIHIAAWRSEWMGRRTCFWICGPNQYPSQTTHLILGGRHHLDIGKLGAGRERRRCFPVDRIRIHGCCATIVRTQFAMGNEEVVVRGAAEEMGDRGDRGGQGEGSNSLDMGHLQPNRQCCMGTVL